MLDVLKLPFFIIKEAEGEHDGLVSVKSAKWKNGFYRGTLNNADHLNELGWWDHNQFLTGEGPDQLLKRIHRFYKKIAKTLP